MRIARTEGEGVWPGRFNRRLLSDCTCTGFVTYFHNERKHSVGQDVEAENTQKQRNDYLDRLNSYDVGVTASPYLFGQRSL